MTRLLLHLLLLALLPASAALGQGAASRPESHPGGILFVVTDKSGLVSNDSPLYLASNHVGWNPGDPSMKLSGRSDLRWQIQLDGPVGEPPLAFKFTRGSWDTCEVDEDLSDIVNRTIVPRDLSGLRDDEPVVIELTIERFADEREGADQPRPGDGAPPLDITGEAFRVQVVGGAGAASGALRDVIVWLPPGYHDPVNANRRYPVLYMQDGQNLFDHAPPTPGEWHADETATRLIEADLVEPIIIVGIPHSGANRTVEYLPTDALGIEGEGDAYLDWVVREVIPRVERVVRAANDPRERGIGGSSLGGLIALRAAQRYPGVFGRVLAESPSLAVRGERLDHRLFPDLRIWLPRTWIAVGTAEAGTEPDRQAASDAYASAVIELASTIDALADPGDLQVAVVDGAGHTEADWAERLGEALEHLYPGPEK